LKYFNGGQKWETFDSEFGLKLFLMNENHFGLIQINFLANILEHKMEMAAINDQIYFWNWPILLVLWRVKDANIKMGKWPIKELRANVDPPPPFHSLFRTKISGAHPPKIYF
jgi:hypothetical protein